MSTPNSSARSSMSLSVVPVAEQREGKSDSKVESQAAFQPSEVEPGDLDDLGGGGRKRSATTQGEHLNGSHPWRSIRGLG